MSSIRWEYITRLDPDEDELRSLGEAGWELAGVAVVQGREKLYLKRPAPSLSEEITLSQRDAALRGDGP